MFYSRATHGFYDPDIHVNIPADAVEISAEEHADLLAGQSSGKTIVAGLDGRPALTDPPPSVNEALLSQIRALEATVTARRIREAVLGVDNGWLAALNADIALLRGQLQ